MRRTAYVETSDGRWVAFYVDGQAALQGESLRPEDLFPVLESNGLLDGAVEASAGEYDTSDDPDLASFGNRFPERLADLEGTGRVSWSI